MTKIKSSPLTIRYITMRTLVGGRRNCCSVIASDDHEYKIVNAYAEDITDAIQGPGRPPVAIKRLSDRHAIVTARGFNPKRKEYCTVCCPRALMPARQRNRIERQEAADIARGDLKITTALVDGVEYKISSYRVKPMTKVLIPGFTIGPTVMTSTVPLKTPKPRRPRSHK